jgi:quinol monooxygenase YgiN
VSAAVVVLHERNNRDTFTVREVYAEMQAGGTGYAEPTVSKAMQRMKEMPVRPPYVQLERAGRGGFRLIQASL